MAVSHDRRALALVGSPFRPQGRDPAKGLDCVGLCLAAYDLPPRLVRDDYRLRGDYRIELEAAIENWFHKVSLARSRAGDLLLMMPTTDQLHLGIRTVLGLVHADARLRRVVEVPGQPRWPIVGVYRLRARKKC